MPGIDCREEESVKLFLIYTDFFRGFEMFPNFCTIFPNGWFMIVVPTLFAMLFEGSFLQLVREFLSQAAPSRWFVHIQSSRHRSTKQTYGIHIYMIYIYIIYIYICFIFIHLDVYDFYIYIYDVICIYAVIDVNNFNN